jgi:predicted nucleic acid-binding protein
MGDGAARDARHGSRRVSQQLVDTSVLAGDVAPQEPGTWAVSVVTIGELEVGVLLAPGKLRARRLARLTGILEQAPVLIVDRRVAAHYAQLRSASGRQPANDLWIAATALAHELLTHTAASVSRIARSSVAHPGSTLVSA